MLKNYLKVALRNLLKNKRYVIINTFGLGVALACCITSYILVAYNLEFDDFHAGEKTENIFRLHAHVIVHQSDKRQAIGAPSPIGPAAFRDFSGIKRFMRYAGNAIGGASVSYQKPDGQMATFSENVVFADSTLFELFDFPLVSGSHEAFNDIQTVFLNRETAKKYFGDEDPIGQVLTFGFARGVTKKMTVGGVLRDIPINSSIQLPMVMRFEHFIDMRAMDQPVWGDWNVPATFIELEDPAKANTLAPLFDQFMDERNSAFQEQEVKKYTLEPFLSKVDPQDLTWTYLNVPIEPEPLITFVVLATMILLIACFNLTNTSVAMTAGRLKEIGIRKAVGAHRSQVILQLLLETIIVIALSLVVGYSISLIIVPEFTGMWRLPYGLEDLSGANLLITLVILLFFASILVGMYPAFYGTRFQTVNLLKGNVRFKGTNVLTKSLVSVQFAISVIVLIAGVIFIRNTKYQEAIEYGYDIENLLSVRIQDEADYRKLLAEAQSIPEVLETGTTEHQIGYSTYPNPITYQDTEYEVRHLEFGENYFEVMKFDFVKGRPLDHAKTYDFEHGAVVSEAFLRALNIEGDPLGQEVDIRGVKKTIVGVIRDFVDNVYGSDTPEPFIFYATVPDRWREMLIRAEADDLIQVNEALEAAWRELFPDKQYESNYHEEIVMGDLRQTNRNLQKIFLFLTVLGGLLSASGIFSLASLSIARRTKEIGIRKALGASIRNVVLILNREFVIILGIAAILGSFGGFFGTSFLLDMIYAHHVPITLVPVALSAIAICTIGLATTGVTILQAARSNPVDTLRDE